jgi:hypothetical protein
MSAVSSPMGMGQYVTTTFLGFNNLVLPEGLEYVDDLSTATGNWR